MVPKKKSKPPSEHEGGLRWELGSLPSAQDVEARFDALLRRRWSRGADEGPAQGSLLFEDVWVEIDFPEVGLREVRARLEVRVERRGLRMRIRPVEEP